MPISKQYDFHCADFNGTQNISIKLHGHLMLNILPKVG